MSNLKACPFCGRIPDIEYCGEHRWFIRCKCGIAQDKLYRHRFDALRVWNKRKELRDKDTNVPITDTIPSAEQEAISIEWINKHLEWLDNCDNEFAQLAKGSIKAMVDLWQKDRS